MRSFPFDPTNRDVHALIEITLRDSVLRFTTAETDQVSDGNTYLAQAAANLTQIQYLADGTPSNADVSLSSLPGGLVSPGAAARGELDGLPITISLFQVGNIDAGVYDMMPGATIGNAQEDSDGQVVIAAQGKLSLARAPLTELYTTVCKAALGDHRCKIPLDVPDIGRGVSFIIRDDPAGVPSAASVYGRVRTGMAGDNSDYGNVVYECTVAGTTHASIAPTYDPIIDNTTVDGTATFTARDAWLRSAVGEAIDFFNIQLTALPDPLADGVPEWFVLGNLIPRTGPLAGIKIPVRAFDSATFIVTLFEPFAVENFPADTQFDIHRGCDKLLNTCTLVFDNINNMRATPLVPGANIITGKS